MTDTVTIRRELLERLADKNASLHHTRKAQDELRAAIDSAPCDPRCAETCVRASMCATCMNALAAPRQPEEDAASILLPALRQYMHNDGSGLLAGYEYERTQQIVAELRERIDESAICDGTDATISDDLFTQLVGALDAPLQPAGDGLEVVESLHVWRATNRFGDTCHFGDAGCARAWAGNGGKVDRIELKPVPELYDVNHADAAEVSATEIKVVAWVHCADATRLLCDLGKQRSVPGHYADEFTIPLCRLSDAKRAIAELHDELDAAREILAQQGRNNTELRAERDTLRQQLAERDATIARLEAGIPRIQEQSHQMRQQRDRLAGLLADVKADYTHAIHWEDMHATMKRIDAALAKLEGKA